MLFNIVLAFVYSFGVSIKEKKNYKKESIFVYSQLLTLPWYFRYPIIFLILILNFIILTKQGRPFHNLNQSDRSDKINLFRKFKIGPFKDVVKFFDNLTKFAIYSYEEI